MPESQHLEMISRIRGMTHEREAIVVFTKQDGKPRIMRCRQSCPLDKGFPDAEILIRDQKNGTMTVWDLDARDWRCFVIGNVSCYTVMNTDAPVFGDTHDLR